MKLITALLAVAAFSFTGTPGHAETEAESPEKLGLLLAHELAERYGLSEWGSVDAITFTFAVDSGERKTRRPWHWDVKANTVTANHGTPDAVTFSLDDEITDDLVPHHRHFINDSYWLLFPFYIVWSDNTVTDEGEATMPISGEPAHKLTVQYPAQGGYTPGDAYDVFIDPDTGLIGEWSFRKGGKPEGWPTTWAHHKGLNGLWIAQDHRGADPDGFRLYFPVLKVHAHGGVAVGTIGQ